MQNFRLRTAMGGIALTTLLSASMVTGNLTSHATSNIGKAKVSIGDKDPNFLNSEADQLAGWKIFQYKVVQAVGDVAEEVGQHAADEWDRCWTRAAAPEAVAQLSEKEVEIQQSTLLEELN